MSNEKQTIKKNPEQEEKKLGEKKGRELNFDRLKKSLIELKKEKFSFPSNQSIIIIARRNQLMIDFKQSDSASTMISQEQRKFIYSLTLARP